MSKRTPEQMVEIDSATETKRADAVRQSDHFLRNYRKENLQMI